MYQELTIPLFPSVFYAVEIREDLEEEYDKLKSVEFISHGSEFGDNGSQNSKSYHVLDSHDFLKRTITNYVRHFKDDILGYTTTRFSITTSWVTKTPPGGWSELHNHKNSWYSGVLYMDDIPDCGDLYFFNNERDIIPNDAPTERGDILNAETFVFSPKKSNLVLFPSYLNHRVSKNKSNQDRYSLAFNIFPRNTFGRADSTLNITIKK